VVTISAVFISVFWLSSDDVPCRTSDEPHGMGGESRFRGSQMKQLASRRLLGGGGRFVFELRGDAFAPLDVLTASEVDRLINRSAFGERIQVTIIPRSA
jgi:hypothetical protein